MKAFTILFSAVIFCLSSASLWARVNYIQTDLVNFEKTNKCSGCDLSNIEWGATKDSTFQHDKADLQKANLSNSSVAGGDIFNLTQSNLVSANFSNFNVESSSINFSGADLRNSIFVKAFMAGSNFSQTDLTGAAFYGANLSGCNFYQAVGADFEGANVCNAILPDGSKGKCN